MAQKQPLVSVIIPVFGVEDYLERCVRSVTGQSHANLEVFLVDDGSPDRCPEMCDTFARADSRITVIHQENAGQGAARNAALDVCSGDYILFVDSDDWIDQDMVHGLVTAAQETNSDLAICGHRAVGALRTREHCFYDSQTLFDSESLMRAYLLTTSIPTAPWAKLYRRHLFDHIRFPAIRMREDVYIMHEIIGETRRAVFVPESYYMLCLRSGSTERSAFSPKRLVSIEISDRLVEYVRYRYPSMVDDARYQRARRYVSLMIDIRSNLCYRQYREPYDFMRARLKTELRDLTGRSPDYDLSHVARAVRGGPAFNTRCVLIGARRVMRYRMNRALLGRLPTRTARGC